MNKHMWLTTLVGAALLGTLLTGCGQADDTKEVKQSSPKTYSKPPEMKIDKSKEYTATLDTTKGKIKIKLFDDDAPVTVNNFIFLARDHFYDGVKFHRIIKDFMVQTGDPLGNGRGGPGYKFKDELPPKRPYAPGIVAMANAGPNTNGSQFFICTGDQVKSLDPAYTQFGEVVEGMDVVKAIAATPVEAQGGEMSKPKEEIKINSVTIEEK
jgi:cyclophilin family peptidyl-prolyl cis-trans isomerase